jgi:hypothetical protein
MENAMMRTSSMELLVPPPCSELVLSDRLIALAEDADRAGYTDTAEMLVNLACSVFDEASKKPH